MYLVRQATMTALLFAFAAATSARAVAHAEAPGPKVGETVPEFSLVDQTSEGQTLKSIAGERPLVALVFYRSASW